MENPFATLGLPSGADPGEIRAAYRALVKQNHPDTIQDPERKREAQERMVRLNLAYEEALRLSVPRSHAHVTPELNVEDAIRLAEQKIGEGHPEGALRQLLRAENRNAVWYYTQGKALSRMGQYDSANQSFREAIRRDPDNREYRREALDAVVAMRQEKTLSGRVRKLLKNIKR